MIMKKGGYGKAIRRAVKAQKPAPAPKAAPRPAKRSHNGPRKMR